MSKEKILISYRMQGVPRKESVIFRGAATLQCVRSDTKWVIKDDGKVDVIVAGNEFSFPDGAVAAFANGAVVLSINTHIELKDRKVLELNLPLRQEGIFKMLDAVYAELLSARGSLDKPDQRGETRFKLAKWPSWELMEKNPSYPILATALINRAMSINAMAKKTGLAADICLLFINMAEAERCLETFPATNHIEDANDTGGDAVAAPEQKRKGLFAKIRKVLGI